MEIHPADLDGCRVSGMYPIYPENQYFQVLKTQSNYL